MSARAGGVRGLLMLVVACGPTGAGDIDNGDGDGGNSKDDGVCAVEPELIDVVNLTVPPDVLIVLDRSGSMNQAIDPFDVNGPSRWEIMRSAVSTLAADVDVYVRWGLSVFPTDLDCGVEPGARVEIADLNAAEIGDYLDLQTAEGNTPALPALVEAAKYYGAIPVNAGGQFVLFVTDGAPNCGETDLVGAVTNLATAGIHTFVLGFGDDLDQSARQLLDETALAGQEPRPNGPPYHYQANTVQELADAFRAIATGAIAPSCSYRLARPADPERLSVTLEGEAVPRDRDSGWDLNPDDTTLGFFGGYCDRIQSGSFTAVEVSGCPD